MELRAFGLSISCVLLAFLQVRTAYGDVRLSVFIPTTSTEVVAYNNSYIRAGSFLSGPFDSTQYHFVLTCSTVGSNRSDIGQWYYPNGSAVGETPLDVGMSQERQSGKVILYRYGCLECGSQVGVYKCLIPDLNSVNQTLYAGVYISPTTIAERPISTRANFGPNIAGGTCDYLLLTYPHVDPPMFQLSCTTKYSPATVVNWTLNSSPVPTSTTTSYQTITNFIDAVYSNVLMVTGRVAGLYVCNVTTRRIEAPDNPDIAVDTMVGTPAIGSLIVQDSPGPPNISNVIQLNSTTLVVSWTVPTSGGAVQSYWVHVGSVGKSFTSNTTSTSLSLPVSNKYTIEVVALGRHLPSVPSAIVVELVTPPAVSITQSPPFANAGTSLTLRCTVQFLIAPLSPVTIWWTNSTKSVLNSITVQDNNTVHTLDFTINSISASDGGAVYTCGVAVAKYTISNNTTVFVTVAVPFVTAKASSPYLTAGDNLQLNCTGLLTPYLNVPGQVTMTWIGPSDVPFSAVTTQFTAGGTFLNNVPVSAVQLSSAGTYTCRMSVVLNDAPFVNMSSNAAFDQVTVVIIAGPLSLNIKVPDTLPRLGMPYSISCIVTVPPLSSNAWDLSTRWRSFDTVVNNMTVRNAANGTYQSMLTFASLNASMVGTYRCEADLGPISATGLQDISVVVPQPTVTITSNPGLYIVAGDTLTLTCVVQLDAFKYIDTGAVLNITWRYSRGREQKMSRLVPFTGTLLSFATSLQLQADLLDAGNYSCRVTLQVPGYSVFLISSDPVENTVELNVLERNLTISMVDSEPMIGYPYNLTCQINTPAISTTALLLRLELTFSTDTYHHLLKNITISNPGNATHQLEIQLPSLTTADAGAYVCSASLGPYQASRTKIFAVQVPPPLLVVSAMPSTSIVAGQSVTLQCSGLLSATITTDVSVNVSWTGPLEQPLKTHQILHPSGSLESQLYLSSVPFRGAGNYTCSFTIVPESLLTYVYSSYTSSQIELAVMNGNMSVAIEDYGKPLQLGSPYNLQCNVDVPALSVKGQTLQLEWILFSNVSSLLLNSTVIADPGNRTHQFQVVLPYLSTADAGTYICLGSIGSYRANASKVIALQFPPPVVSVTAEPTDFVIAQQSVTLVCSISLLPSIKTNVIRGVSWLSPSGQTLASEHLPDSLTVESKLPLPILSLSSAGNYTCLVSIVPQFPSIYLFGINASSQVRITVMTSALTIAIQEYNLPQLGSPYNLQCNVSVPELSGKDQTLQIEWLMVNDIPSSSPSSSLNKIAIAGPGSATYYLPISLPSLSPAYAGRYMCIATFPPYTLRSTRDVVVQVPNPDLVTSASPSATVVAGTNITLNCCASFSSPTSGNFIVNFTWILPDGSTLGYESLPLNSTLSACARISLQVQSSAVYTCNATVRWSSPSVFILDSVPSTKPQSVTVYPDIQVTACKSSSSFSEFAKALCMLTRPPSEIFENILNITSDVTTLDPQDISIVGSILAELVRSGAKDNKKIQEDFIAILNNILSVNKAILYQSGVNPLFVETTDFFTKTLSIDKNDSIKSFTENRFVLQAQDLPTSLFQSVIVPNESYFDAKKANPKFIAQNTFVTLPSTLFQEVNLNSTPGQTHIRVSSSIFLDDHFFQPQQNVSRHFSNYSLGSLIVSASLDVGVPVRNLKHPVQISMKLKEEAIKNGSNITCVFWDTAAHYGIGDWSTEGCVLVSNSNGTAMCECNHLTSFAIIFDVQPKTISDAAIGLGVEIITFVGLGISILSLLVVMATYIISRKLRTSILGKMLLNLCGSLLILFAVFIASSVASPVSALCSFFSALLHYSLLAYFFWTASEAIHLYLKLVQVFETRWLHRHYVAVSMAVCWGAPLIIVAISLSGYKDYGNQYFCRPYELPFYIGFIVPFAIIYIFNWVMFVITFVSICHHVTRNDTGAYETFKKQFKIAVTISLLLGLGWAFGFLGTSSLPPAIYIPAQYFFSFFMASQGALFLFFHGIKSAEVRQEWIRLFYVATGRSDKYRLYLQKSKTRATDSTQKSTVTTTKVKSRAYSVDESHTSTDVKLERLPTEEKNELSEMAQNGNVTESCLVAWKDKDSSTSNGEQPTPSNCPEHTFIDIPQDQKDGCSLNEVQPTPSLGPDHTCIDITQDQKDPSSSNAEKSNSPEHTNTNVQSKKECITEDAEGQITFNVLYVATTEANNEQTQTDIKSSTAEISLTEKQC